MGFVHLRDLLRASARLGRVVDEYGGIVALEELLEEIVGAIYDEYDLGVPPAGRIVDASGAVLVDGSLIVQELPEVAGIEVTAVDGPRVARVRIVTEPFPDAGRPGR
ncbi:MAG: hypothetical protein ABWX68_11140 [Arthrobacter sp.]|uniref:hypothetical protein n=1 Tax=Arthrobacter sp. TaxID=1667 RepID=UPI0034705A1D